MNHNKPGFGWGEIIGFALLAVALGIIIWPRSASNDLVPVGTPLPALMVEGWLNSSDVSADDLKSSVVVMDCWATWCPPCREALPRLAKLYAEYEPLGVQFIGLTPEDARSRQSIESFIGTVDGFSWPVGYGSSPTLDVLGIRVFPTLIVFDETGHVLWSSTSTDGLRSALDEALAR